MNSAIEELRMSSPESSEPLVTETMHTVSARDKARKQLEADLEAYLKTGGSVEAVAHDYRADPPKKPENNYGRGSI